MTVHIFIVESNEVVCMPDIHKIVQNIHGNSIQVNYYFNKLKVSAYQIYYFMVSGWLAHLARHAPPNKRVKYAVGSSPTGSIIRN